MSSFAVCSDAGWSVYSAWLWMDAWDSEGLPKVEEYVKLEMSHLNINVRWISNDDNKIKYLTDV